MRETALAARCLARLRELVAAEGEAISPALGDVPGEDALGPLVEAAAAARTNPFEYAVVVESVLEGYLLHCGRSRLLDTSDDDLRLLAGDYMYALGLSRLARLEDLAAVRALADLISLSARHRAAGSDDADMLAGLWALSALAVGGGPWKGYEQAIAAARAGQATPEALLAEVERRTSDTGIGLEAQHALIAIRAVAIP